MFGFLKTTVIGGLIFLVPVVVLAAILGKAYNLMMVVAKPLNAVIPIEAVGGVALVNLLAIVAILVVCFIAGFVAKSSIGQRAVEAIDAKLTLLMPGYAYIKSMTGSLDSAEKSTVFKPVIARFDDQSQLAFEVERTEEGLVVVFLPGAPDPRSGTVAYFTEDRIEPIEASFLNVTKSLRVLGQGSAAFISNDTSRKAEPA